MGFKKRSIFTQQLYNRLRIILPGEFVSYVELSDLIGMQVQAHLNGTGYRYLETARRLCLNNDELVFRPVIGKGLECLTDNKKPELGYKLINTVRKKTNRVTKEILTVSDYSSLSNKEKIVHNTALSVLGAFRLLSKPNKIAKIEGAMKKRHKEMSFIETIELFK